MTPSEMHAKRLVRFSPGEDDGDTPLAVIGWLGLDGDEDTVRWLRSILAREFAVAERRGYRRALAKLAKGGG